MYQLYYLTCCVSQLSDLVLILLFLTAMQSLLVVTGEVQCIRRGSRSARSIIRVRWSYIRVTGPSRNMRKREKGEKERERGANLKLTFRHRPSDWSMSCIINCRTHQMIEEPFGCLWRCGSWNMTYLWSAQISITNVDSETLLTLRGMGLPISRR